MSPERPIKSTTGTAHSQPKELISNMAAATLHEFNLINQTNETQHEKEQISKTTKFQNSRPRTQGK